MTSLIAKGIAIPGRLQSISMEVQTGELVAIVGPNGGGKTSLLRALARVEGHQGHVTIDGNDLDRAGEAQRRQLLAFLPASRDVRWPIAVRDLVALGLSRPDPDRISALVTAFELQSLADRPTDALSTGERARVLMARALAAKPRVLMLDEPLSNLDPYWVLRFLDIVVQAASEGQTVMVALHDLAHLPRFDRTILVADGAIQMDETPADLLASERFGEVFRVRQANGGWQLNPTADPQSLR